jgi:superfamily II DNA or RNA helicase
MSRRFSQRQRRALYLAAAGHCEMCGAELDAGWHADHVVPHSKGGATTIENGQALCPSCNQSKSDSMSDRFKSDIFGPTPHEEPLDWQDQAVEDFTAHDNFLADATPGSGKTAFAAYLFRRYYQELWERIFVVTNSRQRRGREDQDDGWIGDLNEFGIPVLVNWAGRDRTPTLKGYMGGVMTYHILPGNEHDLRALTQKPSLVVFDEIHHLGDQMSWGQAAVDAFDHENVHTVGLTGTPFRSDDVRIPFVDYESDGEEIVSQGHVGYTYGDALSDGNLRYAHFPTWDGEIEWHGRDGEKKSAWFEEDLNEQEENERLRAAVQSKEWTLEQIREADEKLSQIRSVKPDAAGLIVAKGKSHARQICEWMRSELGRDPVLVESDQKRAHDRITEFKDSDDRWIVAIQMVSEGVNIKRLRVGVYASNITAPLFLHQVIGRVLRGPDGNSWFWFPADERIVEVLDNIREMRDHVIEESGGDGGDGGNGEEPSLFMPITADPDEFELLGPLFDEIENMDRDQLEDVPPEVLRDYIAKRGDISPKSSGDGQPEKPRQVREKELRDSIQAYAVRAAAKAFASEFNRGGREKGIAISKMHQKANRRVGISDTDTAPLEKLKEKEQVLQNIIKQSHER